MLNAFERMVAFRYLRARREEGLISVIALFSLIGISLGVATLIVVLAVMNGVRAEMIKSIIGLEGHVTVYANATGITNYDDLAQQLASMPGVITAMPRIEGHIMASYRGAATGSMVSAYRFEDLKKKKLLMERISQGDASALERGEGIVVGSRMAEKMQLLLGDALTLISPEGRATVAGLVPRVKAYPVLGMFSIGMFAYDNGLILMPFADAQHYFKLREGGVDMASAIEIVLENPDDAPKVALEVSRMLGREFRVYDWKNSNSHIFQAVIVQRNVMFLILTLIILVASFNIVSSLIMLVREKSRDIAVLRTMGAGRRSIMRIFMVCGAMVGVIGTVLGVMLGLLVAFNTENIQAWLEHMMGHRLFADELYFLSHLPARVDGAEVVVVAVMAFALSLIATLYPARRASRLDPAEVLRYE